MLLSELLTSTTPLATGGTVALEIQGLCYDSRQVKPGGLFFALKGVSRIVAMSFCEPRSW